MSKDLIDALGEALTLVGEATPGEWRWSENGNIMAPGSLDVDEIAAVYTERDDDLAPANAKAIIAAVNLLRQHGEAIAAVLRAVEGAQRRDVREAFCGGRVGWIEGSLPQRYIGEVAVIPMRELIPLDAAGSAEGRGW